MTKIEKLELADKYIQDIQISNDLGFFSHLLPDKMTDFFNLIDFSEIENSSFQSYLSQLRERLSSTIEWCKKSRMDESDWQKNYTLTVCKRDVSDALHYIKEAIKYYLGSDNLILKDES